ncbi:hypothetical protein Taro_052868 [Colocasia esculenta]|uniref:Uncharacterized protein n=1 Tax=Colocasia esculenta TaxID=4460 RepID=A0A843XLB6_COLES|nr:hypothetical protein [Colocasia esculenta]
MNLSTECRAVVSIYTLSLDLDELSVGYSFCRTSESLFKASVSRTMTLHTQLRRDQSDERPGYYKGKTFEDVVKSIPPGVDPSDWRIMCEKLNTRKKQVKTHPREHNRRDIFKMGTCKDLPNGTQQWIDDESSSRFEWMTQMTTPTLQSDDVAPISAEDAFIAVMGRDRPGRVRCTGKAVKLGSWYGRGEGLSSLGSYYTQLQQQ